MTDMPQPVGSVASSGTWEENIEYMNVLAAPYNKKWVLALPDVSCVNGCRVCLQCDEHATILGLEKLTNQREVIEGEIRAHIK